MGILVVGSIALDSIETPFGKQNEILGGSASYFSLSASFFEKVRVVAVVGDDFSEKYIKFLSRRNIDLKGLQKEKGKTFRWIGKYDDLNNPTTLDTQLNVFKDFKPIIPYEYRNSDFVFLANIDPVLQLEVLRQVKNPKVVACDTMNYWIEGKPKELKKLIKKVDIVFMNEQEAKQFSNENNLLKAVKRILSFGPSILVIKRGEYGSLLFRKNSLFFAPAYPLEKVIDPTGAGDSFAGGFMGFLAKSNSLGDSVLRKAMVVGTVMASFCVEQFSLNRLLKLKYREIKKRFKELKRITQFDLI